MNFKRLTMFASDKVTPIVVNLEHIIRAEPVKLGGTKAELLTLLELTNGKRVTVVEGMDGIFDLETASRISRRQEFIQYFAPLWENVTFKPGENNLATIAWITDGGQLNPPPLEIPLEWIRDLRYHKIITCLLHLGGKWRNPE